LLGIPPAVASAVAFCVAVQLLLQHSNADYRSGPVKLLLANAEMHRFHHASDPIVGDRNFGFTTLWDHLVGTFHYEQSGAPKSSRELGIAGDDQ
jgi:sterol desaturase/sphingolipid hydroxylase (fatty acid hydroxylase superfamily)